MEVAVRKKIAYKRWLELEIPEAKEENLRTKRVARHEVGKAEMIGGES